MCGCNTRLLIKSVEHPHIGFNSKIPSSNTLYPIMTHGRIITIITHVQDLCASVCGVNKHYNE